MFSSADKFPWGRKHFGVPARLPGFIIAKGRTIREHDTEGNRNVLNTVIEARASIEERRRKKTTERQCTNSCV